MMSLPSQRSLPTGGLRRLWEFTHMFRYQPVNTASDIGLVADICDRVDTGLDEGLLPVEVFEDETIFRAEMERIFTRSWVFLGHESEIPKSGDFVRRTIGLDPVILTRGSKGEINVMLNQCRHRGTKVCHEDRGNASHFKCPYHGWIYKNNGDFVGAPDMQAAYGGRDRVKDWGLLMAPRVELLHGLIFACLSEDVGDLRTELGGAAWMLDAIFDLHPGGMRVLAPPQRSVIRADWKSGAENFAGDSYHVGTAHESAQIAARSGSNVRDTGDRSRGFLFGNGHSFVGHTLPDWFGEAYKYWGYTPEQLAEFDLSKLDEAQIKMLETVPPTIGTIFPNLSFLRFPGAPTPGAAPVAFTDLRLWQPLEPGVMEMWHWQLEFDFMPDEVKEASYLAGQYGFGPGGLVEADDTVLWEGPASAARSPWSRRLGLSHNYKQKRVAPDPEWTGPGQFFSTTYGEYLQEGFWRRWVKDMRAGVAEGVDHD